jgi:N-acetyl-gamma-glutamyl-phosphate reductase
MTRGILSTCYARLTEDARLDRASILDLYRRFYAAEPFVHVSEQAPSTKAVAGTNYCVVHPSINLQTGAIVVASALDNLGKGAAGAMVQCLNIMRGYDEDAGLRTLGLFP